MIFKENIIKLGDFGISKALGTHNDFAKTFLGTPYFMPPEVCKGEQYGQKADIWALGCALYEMIMFKRPFQHDVMQIVFDLIINKDYDPLPANTEPEVKSLIERMLQKDPSKRPSIWDLEKIPCIDEKIKLFFKEHSDEGGEGTYGAVGENPQNEQEECKQKEEKKEPSIDEIVMKIRDTIKLKHYSQGIIQRKNYIVVTTSELQNWFQKNESSKNEDQIRVIIKSMVDQKILYLLSGQESKNPDMQMYVFSEDMPSVPMNMTRTYQGESEDSLPIIYKLMEQLQLFLKSVVKKNQVDQLLLDQEIKQFRLFEIGTQKLQKSTMTNYDHKQKLCVFLNLYQIMRIHICLAEYYHSKLTSQIQAEVLKINIWNKIARSLFMAFSSQNDVPSFFYQFAGYSYTFEEIKHAILRGNSKAKHSNFKVWNQKDPRFQNIIPMDQRVLVMFEEEFKSPASLKTSNPFESLIYRLEIFKPETVDKKLTEFTKQFITMHICLDTVESEIVVHPILQKYFCDFSNNNENLVRWILKYMDFVQDHDQIIADTKNQSFFVRFQDPEQQ